MVQMIFSAPGEQPLPAVAWNYEEVKAEVEASLAQYKDRAYTPETIGGAKADRAALNKLADVLAAKRREVKAQYLAPYENFERQCKEVEGMIAAASKAIDAQVKEFEGVEKERKRGTIIEIYQSIAGELVAMVPPAAVWNPKWLNKTYSMDAIRMELEATVQRIHESMETIRQSCGQDAPACLDVYLNEGLNLSAAIRKHQQLEHIRQQEAARPVAPEQLAGLRHQLTGETPPAPPAAVESTAEAADTVELYMDFRVYYTDKAVLNSLKKFLVENHIKFGRVPAAQEK